jgi:hypothetical protein
MLPKIKFLRLAISLSHSFYRRRQIWRKGHEYRNILQVGFKPRTPVFELSKTVHIFDTTVVWHLIAPDGDWRGGYLYIYLYLKLI